MKKETIDNAVSSLLTCIENAEDLNWWLDVINNRINYIEGALRDLEATSEDINQLSLSKKMISDREYELKEMQKIKEVILDRLKAL